MVNALCFLVNYFCKIALHFKSESFPLCLAVCLFSLFFKSKLNSTILHHLIAVFHVSLTLLLF